jgi:hypothetical protein
MFFSFDIYVGFNARDSAGMGAIGSGVFALSNSHVLLLQYLCWIQCQGICWHGGNWKWGVCIR